MENAQKQFVAKVSARGYSWRQGRFETFFEREKCNGPVLIPIGNKSIPIELPSGLFLELAAINPEDDAAIGAFANKYGFLGFSLQLRPANETAEEMFTGEPHADWVRCILQMRQAADLWANIKIENIAGLSQRVRWVGPHHIEYVCPERVFGPKTIAGDSESILLSDHSPALKADDVIGLAQICLQRIVNANLKGHVQFGLLRHPRSPNLSTFNAPTSLNGALWFQLAKTIVDLGSIRGCDVCQKPMVITPGGYRASRRTCSHACRLRIYDSRKHEARRMYLERIPLKEIATHLATSTGQIKRWTEAATNRASVRAHH